ncbi:hypothetical protein Tco_1501274 [Tanacetum coccineum]
MGALIRVLRYLKLCPGQGLFFSATNNLKLLTYCDSDWASCSFSRKSVSGALTDNTCELSWLLCLLRDLHIIVPTPIPILCDNASTIALAFNPIHHATTKHIEIDFHFVRNKIKEGTVVPTFVPSRSQVGDIFTKGLCRFLHYNCLSKLGICNPYSMPT